MLQVKIFPPAELADLEKAVNEYLSNFHRAVSPRDLRISRVSGQDVEASWGPGRVGDAYWATLTFESVRRDLAADPTKQPPDSSTTVLKTR